MTGFIDRKNGNNANSGLDFANREKDINELSAASIAPGDEIRLMRSLRSSGESWTWPANSGRTVAAPTGTAKVIDLCSATTGWVPATNVTIATNAAIPTINGAGLRLTFAANFTTGKAAYKAITLDLSSWEDVWCYVRYSATGVVTGAYLDLCSDTTGDVPIVSFQIEGAEQGNQAANVIMRQIFRNGSALPSNVQSIAIRFTSDPGTTTTFDIHNICATKTVANGGCSIFDYITANSNTNMDSFVGDEVQRLYAVCGLSADDTYVLTTANAAGSRNDNAGKGYAAATGGSLTTYVWEGLHQDLSGTSQAPTEDATETTRSSVVGGYDVTAMTTREAMTCWTDKRASGNIGWAFARKYYDIKNLVLQGIAFSGASTADIYLENVGFIAAGTTSVFAGSAAPGLSVTNMLVLGGESLTVDGASSAVGLKIERLALVSTSSNAGGLVISGIGAFVNNVICENCTLAAIRIANTFEVDRMPTISNLITRRCGNALRSQGVGLLRIRNALLTETTEWSAGVRGGSVWVEDLDNTPGLHKYFDYWGTATIQSSVVNGAEPYALQLNPTNSTERSNRSPFVPYRMPWKLTANTNNVLTVAGRRSNTALNVGIRYCPCQRGSEAGLTSAVKDTVTAAADTWEDISITLNPSSDVIVFVEFFAFVGTTHTGYLGAARFS